MTNIEIIKILDSICERSDYDWLEELASKNGLIFANGATKGVLIFSKEFFVLKWSFDDTFDESMREVEVYEAAKVEGLEKIFPRTEFFYENKFGISFVKQQMVSSDCLSDNYDYCKTKRKSKHIKDSKAYDLVDDFFYTPDNDLWCIRAYHVYGKKFLRRFSDFTEEWLINDLHEANIGYLKNRPVILDFSGYETR